MTTLAADAGRSFELGDVQEYPMIGSDIIFADAAVGQVVATGLARPLVGGDVFLGFAERKVDNAAGAAGDRRVRVRKCGQVELPVAGAVITDPVGTPIYATDDNAFTFSPVGGTFVGKLARFVSSGIVVCAFNVLEMRDPHAGLLAELASTSITTDVQDTGKVICCDTTVVHTLGATAVGGVVRFLNIGAFGAVQISLSPNANDKVQGPNIAGADNTDLINTLATAQRGDYIDLLFGQTDGPVVLRKRGIWATA
ncbi:hypothetical protein [Pseudorhodoplanes sp.]|uniref:hypothetical protein n=1 Tax=Pseudorhodoplanes sp. TaxID=1934341 RepID=UPI003D116587